MHVATSVGDISLTGPVLLTIGTFDGFHRGHHFLLDQASARASEHGYHLVIVTFDPCPAVVLRPAIGRYQLTTATQKLRMLRQVHPTLVLLLQFTPELAKLSADRFLDSMEGRLQLREIWMGEDFRFGRDREGGLELLVQRGGRDGFSLHVVARRNDDQTSISSSRIRNLLGSGDVAAVIPLLGRPFSLEIPLSAAVSADAGLRQVRFVPDAHLAVPAAGWYAALLDGARPTKSPAAVLIEHQPPEREQVTVYAQLGAALPSEIEFIERLEGASYQTAPLEATAIVQAWTRPVLLPTGSL